MSDPDKLRYYAEHGLRACDWGELRAIAERIERHAELIESAFMQQARQVVDGLTREDLVGWWDTMAVTTTMDLGDALVDMGLWERHPEGLGRRWFYRPIKKGGDDALHAQHDPPTERDGDER